MPIRTQSARAALLPTSAGTTTATARLDPLTGQPLAARGKFHNQPCRDAAGNYYPSLGERAVVLELQAAHERGDCTKPRRGRYSFDLNGVHIGRYTSDADVTARRDFALTTRAATYRFEMGKSYVIDVKSSATKTEASQLRFRLMLAFHVIVVVEIYLRPPSKPKPKKARAAKVTA